jgi:hypothetical protein
MHKTLILTQLFYGFKKILHFFWGGELQNDKLKVEKAFSISKIIFTLGIYSLHILLVQMASIDFQITYQNQNFAHYSAFMLPMN